MIDHYRALGCTVSKLGTKRKSEDADGEQPVSSFTATLKIPLNFPKPRKAKKSKDLDL